MTLSPSGTSTVAAAPRFAPDVAALVTRATALAHGRPRAILGIMGAPGSGKSTLAEAVVSGLVASGLPAVHVPMDGFHLSDAALELLRRRDRKGAPDTFDAAGYAAMLGRLRVPRPGESVWAPGFERELEQPIAGVIPVGPEVRVVVTEGNYLLLGGEWAAVRPMLDEVWSVTAEPVERRRRLVARHVAFGKTRAEAEAWVEAVDEPNARLVEASMERADLRVAAL